MSWAEWAVEFTVENMSCDKKIVFSCAVVSVLLLSILVPIHGISTGAPAAACKEMTPGHGELPQNTTSPFKTEIPVGAYVLMDDSVKIELRSTTSDTFKGFLVMAFDSEDASTPIGTFKQPVGDLAQLMNCTSDGVLNAATHTTNAEKTLVNLEWQPPKYYMGTAVFRTTYVKDKETYWIKTESITVSFVMEIPSSAPRSNSVWAGLMAVSLLAFLMR